MTEKSEKMEKAEKTEKHDKHDKCEKRAGSRGRRKSIRGELRALLDAPELPQEGEGCVQSQMLQAVVRKAMGGDLKALEFIVDLAGEEKKAAGETLVRVEMAGLEELAR